MDTNTLVADYLARGGTITVCRKGTPKDLQRMKSSGWLFGGRHVFVATMHKRHEDSKGDMFGGSVAKPMGAGRRLAYDFA